MPEIDPQAREEFLRHFPVSHETAAKFDRYAELLAEWNGRFNLISESTLPAVWRRHFLDSAQLLPLLPEQARSLADLGSGAGFPGVVLSILVGEKTRIHLIESTGKKANFLRTVVEDLKLNAEVRQMRIESIHRWKADIVTARALKPLPELLALAKPLMHKNSTALFLKGQHIDTELTESGKYWKFDSETVPSRSDSSGRILIIRHLERLSQNAATHKK